MRSITWLAAAMVISIAAAAADPSAFETRKAQVRALLGASEYRAALERAQEVHREWMDDVPTYQLMAEAHLGLGDYKAADSDLQWMLDLREGKADAQGWYLVARFREITGDVDGAVEALGLALGRVTKSDGKNRPSEMLAYAGRLYTMQRRFDAADTLLQQSLRENAGDARLLEAIVLLRLAQGREKDAVATARQCMDASGDVRCLYLLGGMTGDYEAFEKAARGRPDVKRELVLFLAGPGHRAGEALEISRTEASRRQDVGTLDALAVALMANGNKDEARETMRTALASGTRDPEILRHASELGVTAP